MKEEKKNNKRERNFCLSQAFEDEMKERRSKIVSSVKVKSEISGDKNIRHVSVDCETL